MCKKIFIAATGQHCGKTTISLSLMHLARKQYRRVGFIKPLGPKPIMYQGRLMDKDAALTAEIYDLHDDLDCMSPVVVQQGTTKQVLQGKLCAEAMRDQILQAAQTLEERCDFVIIEGAGHGGVGSVVGLNNAQVARMLDAPVVMVSGGGIGNVIDHVTLNLALFEREGADVRLLLANKLITEKREENLAFLRNAFADQPLHVAGGFNYSPVLANPTLGRISQLLKTPLHGDQEQYNRIIHTVQLGAASSQRVADLLEESTLLIVTSSRDELLVMLSSLYHLPEYRKKLAGLVIPGSTEMSRITKQILDDSGIPYVRIPGTTAETFATVKDDVSKITAQDDEKIHLIRTLAETELDFATIDRCLHPAKGRRKAVALA
ncbi:AAA family ATPase [uncultured Desulfuromonas sp.]|uniref:AAA family ATPase n=1 Tax=uncultured Desulfuromonas sp. TaxID=181013 RepID=UPI002AABF31F|nr:AAA family ATPase [uncultured Desulfuromonas sp.]